MEFKKTFRIGKKDNVHFNLYLVKKRHIYTCIGVFLFLVLLVGLFSFFRSEPRSVWLALGRGALFGIIGVILWNIYIIVCKIYLRINSMYKKGKLTDFKQEITLNSEGITATTAQGISQSAYKYVVRAEQSRHAFYIVMNESFAYTLPKSQMTSDEIDKVQHILNKYLPDSKKPDKKKK